MRWISLILVAACGNSLPPPGSCDTPTTGTPDVRLVPLGPAMPAAYDDLRYSPALGKVVAAPEGTDVISLIDPDAMAVQPLTAPRGVGSADASATTVFAADRVNSRIVAIDIASNTIIAMQNLQGSPDYVRFSPMANEVWVSMPGTNRLEILDAATLSPIDSVTLPAPPEGLTFSGSRAYTNANGRVTAVDVQRRTIVGEWEDGCGYSHGFPQVDDAYQLAFGGCFANGGVGVVTMHGELVAGYEAGGGEAIVAYNPTLHARKRHRVKLPVEGTLIMRTPILAGFLVLAASSPAPAAPPKPSPLPLTLVEDVRLPGTASRFDYQWLDADNRRLYIAHLGDGSLVVVDLDTNKVIHEVPHLPSVHGVVAAPAQHLVLATATADRTLAIIDDQTFAVKSRVPAGEYPNGLAFDPTSDRVFVSNNKGRGVVVIDVKTAKPTKGLDSGTRPRLPRRNRSSEARRHRSHPARSREHVPRPPRRRITASRVRGLPRCSATARRRRPRHPPSAHRATATTPDRRPRVRSKPAAALRRVRNRHGRGVRRRRRSHRHRARPRRPRAARPHRRRRPDHAPRLLPSRERRPSPRPSHHAAELAMTTRARRHRFAYVKTSSSSPATVGTGSSTSMTPPSATRDASSSVAPA
jgi:YVTN family beta-propeller protein